MKISVITCTYNSAKYLAQTIESVQSQSYRDLEHVFIDGGSTDDTLEIIKRYYPNPILVSEKDKGLYDALNKGMALASGDVFGFLHSDDCFSDKDCLSRIARAFNDNEIDYYSARMGVYNESLCDRFAVLGAPAHKFTWRDACYSSNYFAHPTVYVRRELLPEVGKFNLDYKVAADIDWLWRLEALKARQYFDDFELVKMRHVGTSAQRYFDALGEEFRIAYHRFGLRPLVVFTYAYHFLRRLLRFFLEGLGLIKSVSWIRKRLLELSNKKHDK